MATEPVHEYFCLSYDNFVVLHRSIMQSMPVEWQTRMVRLLQQADAAVAAEPNLETAYCYRLQALDDQNRFAKDPVPHYCRGRTRVFGPNYWHSILE